MAKNRRSDRDDDSRDRRLRPNPNHARNRLWHRIAAYLPFLAIALGWAILNNPQRPNDTFTQRDDNPQNQPLRRDYTEPCTVIPGSIYDGDTLRVNCSGDELKIRFCGIDAPEKNQPGGIESRDYLRGLIGDGAIALEMVEVDRYGRTVGELWKGDRLINLEMVKGGHAWVYHQYLGNCPSREAIAAADQNAGLTGTPPWEWRKQNR